MVCFHKYPISTLSFYFIPYSFFSKFYEKQIEEYKLTTNNDEREITLLTSQTRKCQNDIDSLREQVEASSEHISELKRKLSKSDSEIKLWKSKYETEACPKIDDLDEENKKLKSKFDEHEKTLADYETKISLLKKQKYKLSNELKESKQNIDEQTRINLDKSKKNKEQSDILEKLRRQIEDLKEQLEKKRKEINYIDNDFVHVKKENEDLKNQVDSFKHEIANLQSKFSKHSEDLSILEMKNLELETQKKKIETEKDDLIQTVDDLEFSHEKANTRYNTLYADYEKIRVDLEQKVEEKENEARDVAQKLQTLIDTERSKLEFEQKCSNELKRYIILKLLEIRHISFLIFSDPTRNFRTLYMILKWLWIIQTGKAKEIEYPKSIKFQAEF